MKTILVVDDTAENIDIISGMLDAKYTIKVAPNGMLGLKIIINHLIDCVLLDVVMPDMNGYEVCKRIRSDDKIKDIPIIFITATADENHYKMAREAGGNETIRKPFEREELLERISHYIRE